MWVRKRIDIGWLDLLSARLNCVLPGSRSVASREAEAAWSIAGRAFACLSVRSGLDLLLKSLALPPGSEVLVSALTIPDMVRIIEHHGLVAVPVDLHDQDVSPRVELLEKVITKKTKAILVAQLFGSRFDLAPFVEALRAEGTVGGSIYDWATMGLRSRLLLEDLVDGLTGWPPAGSGDR